MIPTPVDILESVDNLYLILSSVSVESNESQVSKITFVVNNSFKLSVYV